MNRSLFLRVAVILVAVAWIFLVIFGYYIIHKPFGRENENAVAILSALADVVLVLTLYLLAAGLGARVTRSLAFASSLQALVFRTGLGLGLLSFASLGLGIVGLLNPVLFWLVFLAGLVLLRRDILSTWRDSRVMRLPTASRFEQLLACFVGLALVTGFLFALTPPVAWDAQTYHLVEAKVALARGRIAAPPDILYFSFPSLVEMLFLAAMILKGDIAAQLVHFGFLVLTLGALYAFAAERFNSRIAWLACAILVAVPSLLVVATSAYVDVALVFCALAALYALITAYESGDRRWYALAGVFAGLSMGIKYTGAIVPVALGVLVLLSPRTWRPSFLITAAGFAVLFALPWYVRNWAFTGNPVYPFVFGGADWDGFRGDWFSRFGTGLMNTPLQILSAPWDATIFGREGGLGYEATIGPLLLALAPLLVLGLVWRSEPNQESGAHGRLREPLIFAAVLYLFWLVGIAGSKLLLQTRLLFPAFPILALAASVALERLSAFDLRQFSAQRFARLVLMLVLGMTAFSYVIGLAGSETFMYLSGAETRETFVAHNLGPYNTAIKYLDSNLPANAKVLFLWEPRSYYVRANVQPDAILDIYTHLRWKYADADSIAGALQQAGYTHLLLNRAGLDYQLQSGYDPISSQDVETLVTLTSRYLKQVYGQAPLEIVNRDGKRSVLGAESDPYAIYEIAGPGAE